MRFGVLVVGWLVALAVAVAVFATIGSSVVVDAWDLAATWGWWALLALLFPAAVAVAAFFSRD